MMRLKHNAVIRTVLLTVLVGGAFLVGVTVPAGVQSARAQDDAAESTKAAAVVPESSGFPTPPHVTLATPSPGYAVKGRADVLAATAKETGAALKRAEYLLAAANITLSLEVEPFCTRRFLRIESNDDAESARSRVETLLGRATERLNEASAAIDAFERGLADTDSGEDGKIDDDRDKITARTALQAKVAHLRRQTQALRAFAGAEATYLSVDEDNAGNAGRARAAASELAPLLEEQDRSVAAAALFWQSLLRSRESDPEAVLSRLDYVSAELPPNTNPYSFLGRVLRCRTLAQHRPKPVALALLLQLEERCYDWFSDESDKDQALRTVALVRLQVLRAWYDSMDPVANRDERAWCAAQARRIKQKVFEGSNPTVFRLLPAVPFLVPAPTPTGANASP